MKLVQCLHEYGLFLRGATRLTPQEIETYGFPVDKPELVLVGNIGSSYWPIFSQSTEYLDGEADPLDRWSRRVANVIAAELITATGLSFLGAALLPVSAMGAAGRGPRTIANWRDDAPRVRALAFVSLCIIRRCIRERGGKNSGRIPLPQL